MSRGCGGSLGKRAGSVSDRSLETQRSNTSPDAPARGLCGDHFYTVPSLARAGLVCDGTLREVSVMTSARAARSRS